MTLLMLKHSTLTKTRHAMLDVRQAAAIITQTQMLSCFLTMSGQR